MLIYWNKRKYLHKKRVQLPQDFLGTPTWPPFHCFGTPIWPPRRHVKTLYYNLDLVCKQKQLSRSANYRDLPETGFWIASTNPPITMERERWKQVKTYLKPLVGIILFRSPAVFSWKQVSLGLDDSFHYGSSKLLGLHQEFVRPPLPPALSSSLLRN